MEMFPPKDRKSNKSNMLYIKMVPRGGEREASRVNDLAGGGKERPPIDIQGFSRLSFPLLTASQFDAAFRNRTA